MKNLKKSLKQYQYLKPNLRLHVRPSEDKCQQGRKHSQTYVEPATVQMSEHPPFSTLHGEIAPKYKSLKCLTMKKGKCLKKII